MHLSKATYIRQETVKRCLTGSQYYEKNNAQHLLREGTGSFFNVLNGEKRTEVSMFLSGIHTMFFFNNDRSLENHFFIKE